MCGRHFEHKEKMERKGGKVEKEYTKQTKRKTKGKWKTIRRKRRNEI